MLQQVVHAEFSGCERMPPVVPAGDLTDGFKFYSNPGNLKPEEPCGGIGAVGAAAPMSAAKK